MKVEGDADYILEAHYDASAIIEKNRPRFSFLSVKCVVSVPEALENFTTSSVGFKGGERHVECCRVKLNLELGYTTRSRCSPPTCDSVFETPEFSVMAPKLVEVPILSCESLLERCSEMGWGSPSSFMSE